MKKKTTILIFALASLLSCEPRGSQDNNTLSAADSSRIDSLVSGNPIDSTIDKKQLWKEITDKLPPLKIPSKIACSAMVDSTTRYELSKTQVNVLIPKERLQQKDPVVSALYNLVSNGSILGMFYYIEYPVIFDQLNDIRCEILLVLYTKDGDYTAFQTLSINDYGEGYSNFKSLKEILYLYTSEMETIETEITTFSVLKNSTIEKTNSIHYSSRGSQKEYDKNREQIEKYMN